MELVKGVPITEYCDAAATAAPRSGWNCSIAVCQAVQHAHQKGIIHRDLKPSNVLVAEYDGRPVPKVIDFGVAKAIGQQLTERTLFTGFGQIDRHAEYMSPEQSRFNELDVDTRSDIYSLGVLALRAAHRQTPFDKQRLRDGGLRRNAADHPRRGAAAAEHAAGTQRSDCRRSPRTPPVGASRD